MKLVLIDDEPFHLIGMQTVIPWEQSQFIIAGEARSGEEGIELILREQPDIAIVDIVMPGIDGLEMIRRVKDAAPETRFIVLSCMNDIQRYKEAVSLGAAEYLQKDLATPDVLLETVRRVAQQLKRERLRNSDGEAHADTAPQLRTEYLNLLLSGTAENLRTAPYQLEKWGLLKRGAPFTVGLLTVQMPDTGSQRAQPPYAGIIAIAQEIFCREGSSCFFRTAGRNIAALLPALSPERMEKAFSRLQSMAESSIDCILSMGISETANDARQIPALYEHAHQACASAYYDGHGKLYRFSASPARHTAGRPAYKRTNTFSAAALHAELDALTVHLKNARPQLPHAAAQLTAFIQRTILLAEQTGIIAGADEVSGDEIAKSCASAAELSLAAAGIHRLIDVLDARRSQSQPDILLRQITEYVQTHLCGKIRLEEGIPAGEGDSAARRLQKIPVTGYFLEDIICAPEPAPPHVGGIRIMAVAAAQAAAGQEKDEADAGAVHGAAGFHGMNQTGDGAFSVRIMVLWKNLRHPLAVRVNGCGKCG